MVGGSIRFSTTGEIAFITAFTSTTQLTVDLSGTVASQSYAIRYGCFNVDKNGLRIGLPDSTFRNGYIIDMPTISATDRFVLRDVAMAMSNKVIYNNSYIALSSDGNRKVFINPSGGITTPITESLTFTGTTTGVIHSVPDSAINDFFVMSENNQTINGIKTFGTSIKLATSGGTASALSDYEENSQTSACTSAIPSTNTTVYWTRIGRVVNVLVAGISATANSASFISIAAIPTRLRPTNEPLFTITIKNNGVVASNGNAWLRSTGVINVYAANFAVFAGAGTSGFETFSFTYSIV